MSKLIGIAWVITLSAWSGPSTAASANDSRAFPHKLACGDASNGTGSEILYTRLGELRSMETLPPAGEEPKIIWGNLGGHWDVPLKDEVAHGYLGNYFKISVDRETFTYAAWTCDSEDVSYAIPMMELAVPAGSKTKSKFVSARKTVSVREDSSTDSIRCVASY